MTLEEKYALAIAALREIQTAEWCYHCRGPEAAESALAELGEPKAERAPSVPVDPNSPIGQLGSLFTAELARSLAAEPVTPFFGPRPSLPHRSP